MNLEYEMEYLYESYGKKNNFSMMFSFFEMHLFVFDNLRILSGNSILVSPPKAALIISQLSTEYNLLCG